MATKKLKWVEYDDGSFETEIKGLKVEVKDGFLGWTLSFIRHGPDPIHVSMPGSPDAQQCKAAARREATKVLKDHAKRTAK